MLMFAPWSLHCPRCAMCRPQITMYGGNDHSSKSWRTESGRADRITVRLLDAESDASSLHPHLASLLIARQNEDWKRSAKNLEPGSAKSRLSSTRAAYHCLSSRTTSGASRSRSWTTRVSRVCR